MVFLSILVELMVKWRREEGRGSRVPLNVSAIDKFVREGGRLVIGC